MFKKQIAVLAVACAMIVCIGCSHQNTPTITGVTNDDNSSPGTIVTYPDYSGTESDFPAPLKMPVISIQEIQRLMKPGLAKKNMEWKYVYKGDEYFPNSPGSQLNPSWLAPYPSWSLGQFPGDNRKVLRFDHPNCPTPAVCTAFGELRNCHVWSIVRALDPQVAPYSFPCVIARYRTIDGQKNFYEVMLTHDYIYLFKIINGLQYKIGKKEFTPKKDTWYCLAITCLEDFIIGQVANPENGETIEFCTATDGGVCQGYTGMKTAKEGYFLQHAVYEMVLE